MALAAADRNSKKAVLTLKMTLLTGKYEIVKSYMYTPASSAYNIQVSMTTERPIGSGEI